MTPENKAREEIDSVRERVDRAVDDAELRGSALIASRALHSAGAFITVFGGCVLIGLPTDTAKEAAVLTGGLAWFSTEATDRISTTIRRVFDARRP